MKLIRFFSLSKSCCISIQRPNNCRKRPEVVKDKSVLLSFVTLWLRGRLILHKSITDSIWKTASWNQCATPQRVSSIIIWRLPKLSEAKNRSTLENLNYKASQTLFFLLCKDIFLGMKLNFYIIWSFIWYLN